MQFMQKKLFRSKIVYPFMKAIIIQTFIAAFFAGVGLAHDITAQELLEKKVSIQADNVQIKNVLSKIEKQTGTRFMYAHDRILASRKISFNASEEKLGDVLKKLLIPLKINFEISGNKIILSYADHSGLKNIETNAPSSTIKGRITDENGLPIPGVNVAVKGTAIGTTTDGDGNYSLQVPDNAKTLSFSFIGYATQEVEIGTKTEISVALVTDIKTLNEVVVVGYGSQEKRKLTSAVATVSGDVLNQRVATSPTTLLQGQLPGLQVTQNSGEPGNEGSVLLIRGLSTFSGAGNDPLVIVNGIPGSLDNLNQNDIESVSLLKDAASCAIYGSRGANGVLLIKTKKGKKGAISVSYNFNYSMQKSTKLPKLITNSVDYMQLSNEANINSGHAPLYTQAQIDLFKNSTDRVKYPNHNWLNDVFQTGIMKTHYLNLSAGTEKTTYSVGIGINDQQGAIKGFTYKKYTLDLGIDSKITKRITFGTNIQMRYGDQVSQSGGSGKLGNAQGTFLSTLAQTPLYGPKDQNGNYITSAFSGEAHGANPIATIDAGASDITKDYYAQGNISLDVDIIDGLKWENRVGLTYDYNRLNSFGPAIPVVYSLDTAKVSPLLPSNDNNSSGLYIKGADNLLTIGYSQLRYAKVFGDHNVNAFVGFEQQQNANSSYNAARSSAFVTNYLRVLDAGPNDVRSNGSNSYDWALRSWYGNVKYDFKDKYLVEVSLRRDASSRLPQNTRGGLFYSFSGAWRVSSESFLKDVSWLNDLKIRASWGQLGNVNIGNYPYQPALGLQNYSANGANINGVISSKLVDPKLKWETTQMTDLGLDLAVLNNKLSFTIDVYNKYTFDILRDSQVSYWIGVAPPTVNNGAVRNKGIDLGIKYNNKIGSDFSYNIALNFQRYKNTLVSFGKQEISIDQYGNLIQATTIRKEGEPLDSYYLYQFDKIFQNQTEIDGSPKQGITPTPGDPKFKDTNGDNKITDDDRIITKGKYPDFQYSMNLGARWKMIDLSFQFYGSQGQKIYANGWGIEPFNQGSAPTTDWYNRWTPTNPTNTLPKIYTAGYSPVQAYSSTFFLKDASFFRMKNVTLGYTLPKNLVNVVGINNLRIYFTASNVFTISKFPGLDPERVPNGLYVSYPQLRTFTIGGAVTF